MRARAHTHTHTHTHTKFQIAHHVQNRDIRRYSRVIKTYFSILDIVLYDIFGINLIKIKFIYVLLDTLHCVVFGINVIYELFEL